MKDTGSYDWLTIIKSCFTSQEHCHKKKVKREIRSVRTHDHGEGDVNKEDKLVDENDSVVKADTVYFMN